MFYVKKIKTFIFVDIIIFEGDNNYSQSMSYRRKTTYYLGGLGRKPVRAYISEINCKEPQTFNEEQSFSDPGL